MDKGSTAQKRLLSRVENSLQTTNIETLDEKQVKPIRDKIKKEINSIPKLSYKQFQSVSQEQRDEYTRLLERLASQSALLIKHKQVTEKQPLTQYANNQTSHFTLMALQMAQERQEAKRLENIERTRQNTIQHKKYQLSPARLLHRLKCSLVEDKHMNELLEFIESSPLLSKYSTLNNSTRKLTINATVAYKDMALMWKYPQYVIEECLLYSNLH
jgi:hypothetical protein